MNKRKEPIKNNLREYRIKAGLTQAQAAKLIGVNNKERICHWEKGNNVPTAQNLVEICRIYKVSIDCLYYK